MQHKIGKEVGNEQEDIWVGGGWKSGDQVSTEEIEKWNGGRGEPGEKNLSIRAKQKYEKGVSPGQGSPAGSLVGAPDLRLGTGIGGEKK